MAAVSFSCGTGFDKNRFIPALIQFSLSSSVALAVNATIGRGDLPDLSFDSF